MHLGSTFLSWLRMMLVGIWLGLYWVLFCFFDHYILSSVRVVRARTPTGGRLHRRHRARQPRAGPSRLWKCCLITDYLSVNYITYCGGLQGQRMKHNSKHGVAKAHCLVASAVGAPAGVCAQQAAHACFPTFLVPYACVRARVRARLSWPGPSWRIGCRGRSRGRLRIPTRSGLRLS